MLYNYILKFYIMNIAEILKDCPKGIKLYSPIFGEVFLDKIKQHLSIVVITDKEQGDFKEEFLYDGRYGSNGECMLFPSNDQRDWTKFQIPFKDGDILADKTADNILCIYKAPMHFNEKCVDYYCGMSSNEEFVIKKFKDTFFGFMNEKRLATEEEKEKLFNVIKANGYKWNAETKTLEKLVEPKFKIGDMIKYKNGKDENGISCGKILSISDDTYDVAVGNNMGVFINIADQENWQLDKFNIDNLKPFDKVLVKNMPANQWVATIYSHYIKGDRYKYICCGDNWFMCIPYEGNEYLLGTTDDCCEYYKTWE